jgi:hypothetical protein
MEWRNWPLATFFLLANLEAIAQNDELMISYSIPTVFLVEL